MSVVSVYISAERGTVTTYQPEADSLKHLVCMKVDMDTAIWLTHAQALKLADDLRSLLAPAEDLSMPTFPVVLHEIQIPEERLAGEYRREDWLDPQRDTQ